MTNSTRFAVGDTVRMNDSFTAPGCAPTDNPYPGTVGKTATVKRVVEDLGEAKTQTLDVEWHEPTGDHGRNWGSIWFTLVKSAATEEPEAPQRPLVHFDNDKAGRDRSAARSACREAMSRTLKSEHNNLLAAASVGESVDAYALNEAITAAIRSAATRQGQSTARREQAKRFAHVAHIVQAVLENHADNLPGYGPGERSRALADLKAEVSSSLADAKREIDHAGAVNQSLTQDLTAAREEITLLKQAASDERRRICGDLDTARGNLSQTIREANEFEAGLRYAQHLLGPEEAQRVEDFILGFRKGASDD